jgi:plasmid stabilization system protein ParE
MSPLFKVQYTPEARADLIEIRDYIAMHSSQRRANGYIRRIRALCRSLAIAPHRGESRAHLRPGLRSIGFEGRVSILFAVFDDERLVEIEGFDYAGRQDR